VGRVARGDGRRSLLPIVRPFGALPTVPPPSLLTTPGKLATNLLSWSQYKGGGEFGQKVRMDELRSRDVTKLFSLIKDLCEIFPHEFSPSELDSCELPPHLYAVFFPFEGRGYAASIPSHRIFVDFNLVNQQIRPFSYFVVRKRNMDG